MSKDNPSVLSEFHRHSVSDRGRPEEREKVENGLDPLLRDRILCPRYPPPPPIKLAQCATVIAVSHRSMYTISVSRPIDVGVVATKRIIPRTTKYGHPPSEKGHTRTKCPRTRHICKTNSMRPIASHPRVLQLLLWGGDDGTKLFR